MLDIWVVYDHPRDHPAFYIVRRQTARPDGTIAVDPQCYGFHLLDDARGWLAQKGLTCLARDPADDPVIVESWI